jgi:asparagine synthase (glutamine-hydrolysing)
LDEELQAPSRRLTKLEEQSFFDIKNYLPEELLVKTDRASMHFGLEVRVPLLDHRLVEFAANLSPSLKLNGQTGKYLLKQVLYEFVPADFFDRPKWGFAIPLQLWLTKELRYLLDKYLSPATVEECGLVKSEQVQILKDQFLNGRTYLYNRIWTLILLHKWWLATSKPLLQPAL